MAPDSSAIDAIRTGKHRVDRRGECWVEDRLVDACLVRCPPDDLPAVGRCARVFRRACLDDDGTVTLGSRRFHVYAR